MDAVAGVGGAGAVVDGVEVVVVGVCAIEMGTGPGGVSGVEVDARGAAGWGVAGGCPSLDIAANVGTLEVPSAPSFVLDVTALTLAKG